MSWSGERPRRGRSTLNTRRLAQLLLVTCLVGILLPSRVSRASRDTPACLGCHDGVIASNSMNRLGTHGGSANAVSLGRASHPVGVAYDSAVPGRRPLRPRMFLDERIILPQGKVECVSCHDAATPKMSLVMSNRFSALCLSCHDM